MDIQNFKIGDFSTYASRIKSMLLSSTTTVPIPPAMTAKYALDGATITLSGDSPANMNASCSLTPEALYAIYSSALTSPGITYYVATTGNDSNNGTAVGTPFLTFTKAVSAANANGTTAKVNVAAGAYQRSGAIASPTVDMAWVATGKVAFGTFDIAAWSAPSKDGTQTNTYSFTRSNCDRVYDLLNVDKFGCYVQLRLVSSAAICNITPGSWFTDGTTVYIQRADGAAVTNTNTRYVLNSVNCILNANNKNIYFGDGSAGSTGIGFNFEGGTQGCLYSNVSGNPSTACIQVFVGCTFRYAGGKNAGGAGCGVAINSHKGAAWFFSCDASANATDGFNCHDANTTASTGMVLINCTGNNNGINPNGSCNGFTSHEDCYAYDFAGRYEENHGGSCRSINTSVSLLAGTYVKNDLGDRIFGGTGDATAFWVDNTAVYYLFRTKADQVAGSIDYFASTGASILKRECYPSRGSSGGAGTIGTW